MPNLPVLMYHNVTDDQNKGSGLTITTSKLEEQFKFLVNSGYTTMHLAELERQSPIKAKSVVITFDDVTENQFLHAVPLLGKYNLKATFFIPFNYVGKTDQWNNGSEKIMTIEQLRSLDSDTIELAHHSFMHRKYAEMSMEEIKADFKRSYDCISNSGLNVYPAVAYPYGNYPKDETANLMFKQQLEKCGIKMGLRIGNRVNRYPLQDKYEIQRIDVKGGFSLLKFRLMLRFGKLF